MEPIKIQQINQELTQLASDKFVVVSKVLFVIVLFKTRLTDSLTYNSLRTAVMSFLPEGQVDLLICDNSPVQEINQQDYENDKFFSVAYLHDPNNPGISLSYNRAAKFAVEKGKKWMLVLDQDSILPENSLDKYMEALITWPDYPIYTPQVYAQNVLLSPCRYFMHRGSPLPHVKSGVNTIIGKNVVNSGLLISLDAYQKVGGYDEKVWLYFSDFVFFNRLKEYYKEFVVVNCRIEHELSSSDYSNYEFAYKRFTYYCQGAKEASESSNTFAYFGYGLTVGMRSILMCRRFKSLSFLEIFYNNFLRNK